VRNYFDGTALNHSVESTFKKVQEHWQVRSSPPEAPKMKNHSGGTEHEFAEEPFLKVEGTTLADRRSIPS
jgi:hypothetical protein